MSDGKTKQKIIDAMYNLVAQKGYDKASIGQIADIVGIKKASVYYYFKSKEEIFLQLVSQLYSENYFEISGLFENGITAQTFKKRMISFGDVLVDLYFEDTNRRKVYAEIDLQSTRIAGVEELYIKSDTELYRFFEESIKQGVALGTISKDLNVAANAQLLYTLVTGLDCVILYNLPADPRLVWREAIAKLLI